MTWPASQQTLEDAFNSANRTANTMRAHVQNMRDASAAGDIPRIDLIDLMRALNQAIVRWNQTAAVPGIEAYAESQFNNEPTFDAAADFVAMRNGAIALSDWIAANFPTHAASGAWLFQSVDASGVRVNLTFTPTQTAGFRTQADAFLATIS